MVSLDEIRVLNKKGYLSSSKKKKKFTSQLSKTLAY